MNKFLILSILLLSLVLVLVLSFSKSKNQPQPLQPWTVEQINRVFDIIRPILPKQLQENPNQQEFQCLVSELSRKISFKDFVNQSDSQKLESFFGIKGKWSQCMRNSVKKVLMEKMNNDLSVPCIIDRLEQTFSPHDINNMTIEDFSKNVMDIILHCKK